ncbi:MAG: hypothetical protein IKF42_06395 [Mogibacterium sp.]|nr:hypothetical protein [Mogibacterium sp.]
MKKTLVIGICAATVCCAYTHRRVIKSLVTGSEMPKAPKWHVWVPADKRRDN